MPTDSPQTPDDQDEAISQLRLSADASMQETLASSPSQSDTVERSSKQLRNYEIIDEIARGGMGVVYRARQVNADRIVALKLIRGSDPDPKELERFEAEAKAAAKLDHPNIVPIYDVGLIAGEPFFTMKLVEGQSLSEKLNGKPIESRLAARIVRDVASGISHAHQHDIIHRDIKPGNVLLDASDTPLVTDFGLAKLSDEESDLTRTGQAIGTPAYMPPEQASGDRDKIDHRSDVYSLGAVLYACLTGRPPFQGSSAMGTVMAVMKDEPVSPRLLIADVPKDLETICLKCLEKDSAARYQSALDLHDDLDRFLSNQPILARPVSTYERTVKWVRRSPLETGLVAAVVLALAGLTAAAVANSYSERLAMSLEEAKTQQALAVNSRNSAEEMRGQAERTNDETQRAIETIRKTEYANKIQFAQLGFENGDMGRASRRLKGTVESNRGWEFDYLTKKYKESFVPTDVLPPREYARRMTFAKDGKSLVSAMRSGDVHLELLRWPCSADQVIEFTLQEKNPLDPNERVNNVFFVDDRGERLIVRTGLKKAYRNFLLKPNWEELRIGSAEEIQFPEPANMLATSETANLAICQQWTADWTPIHSVGVIPLDQLIGQQVPAQEIQRAIVVEPKTWACPGQVMRCQFLADGSRLFATAWDESGSRLFLIVYDTAKGTVLAQKEFEGAWTAKIRLSPDETILAFKSGRRLRLFDSATLELLQENSDSASNIYRLQFASHGTKIILGTQGTEMKVLSTRDLSEVVCQYQSNRGHYSVAEVPEGNAALVSLAGGQTLQLSYDETFNRNRLQLHPGMINSVAVSPDRKLIASCNDSTATGSGEIRVSDLGDLNQSRVIPSQDADLPSDIGWHINSVNWLGFAASSDVLITASWFRTVCFWDVQSGHLLKQVHLDGEPGLNSGVVSADGKYAAFASSDKRVWLVDLESMELERTFLADESLRGIWIDTQARKLFSTSVGSETSRTILFTWSFDSGVPISKRATGLHPVTTITQGPQEDQLVVGMVDGMVAFIDPSSSAKVDRSSLDLIQSGRATIRAIVMNPTKDRCVTINDDGEMSLQDASTLRVVMSLADKEAGISCGAFTADGEVLVTGTKNGDLLIWDASRSLETMDRPND